MKKSILIAFALAIFTKNAISDQIKTAILDALKDPESARFGKEYQSENFACQEVNAKNSYGGYVGKKTASLIKVGSSWTVISFSHGSIYDCMAFIDQIKKTEKLKKEAKRHEERLENEFNKFESKLDKGKKKNPDEKNISYKLLTDIHNWTNTSPTDPLNKEKLYCAGWLSSAIKEDIIFISGLEKKYLDDEIHDIYSGNHPMTPDLNTLINEIGFEKYNQYISKKINPALKILGEQVDQDIGTPGGIKRTRYIWTILLSKAEHACEGIIENYTFKHYK